MKTLTKPFQILLAAVAVLSFAAFQVSPALAATPLTGASAQVAGSSPTLSEFSANLPEAAADQPAGIYVAGTLALPITQQPAGQPAFVSSQPDVLTQFALAGDYGTTGLLAHNHLAGAEFSKLETGQFAALVYSEARVEYYRIVAIERYQALDPNNPYSSFKTEDGGRLSATELFNHVYGAGNGRLVLQTCIAAEGNPSWGRLFVIAEPVTEQVRAALSQASDVLALTSLGLSQ